MPNAHQPARSPNGPIAEPQLLMRRVDTEKKKTSVN